MNEGNGCYDCHDLNSAYAEPDTNYLGSSKRNMSSIKAAWAVAGNNTNGKLVPDEFGCLYCHNSPVPKADQYTGVVSYRMRDASDHFRGKTSSHPVGYDLTTSTDTSGHFLSTFDCKNTSGVYYGQGTAEQNKCGLDGVNYTAGEEDNLGDRAKELDCVDCHDVRQTVGGSFLGYPQHGTPLATNPFMLRAGVGGHNLASGEYDDVCRRCHGSATGTGATGIALFKSTTRNLRLTVHPDASDVTTNVLKEYDGTLLKVADRNNDGVADAMTLSAQKKQCASCHAAHYSSTNRKLFATGLDVANGSKCTDCHFPGDFNNLAQGGNFVKYGHGKAGIDFGCSSCHSVNLDHDPTFPANGSKMFGFSPDTTVSKYGKDLTSICKTCHPAAQYRAHGSGANSVGCIDCHDEHAEGSGSTSNRFMVPQRLPNNFASTELSFFQSTGVTGSVAPGVYDYYVADGNARKTADMPGELSAGVCDNGVCHTGLNVTGTPLSPLSTFMTSGKHAGSDRAAESACSACHKHSDTLGSWRASNSCTSCHGQPPVSTATSAAGYLLYASNADESKTPHTRHVVDYGYDCRECHNQYTNSLTHDTGGTYESIWFDPARNPDAALYPSVAGYTVGTSTCNSLYCHSDGQRHRLGGSVASPAPQWMATQSTPDWSAQNLACNACHGTGTTVNTLAYGAPDHANGTGGHTANSHGKHAFACAVCHNDTIKDMTFADGWTLATPLSGNPHVDGSKSLKADGTTATFTYTPGATVDLPGSCAGISCHGGNGATWGGPALSCDSCHFGAADLNNFNLSDGTASRINSAEWTTTGHGRTTAYPGGNVAAGFTSTSPTDPNGCMYCHDGAVPHATATNPFRLRNRNALAVGLTPGNAYGWNDACLICHSTNVLATGVDPDGAGAAYAPENAQAVDDVNENHYDAKHSSASQGGTFCWDCHDPHGDTNQFMFQGPNGGGPGNGVTQTSAGSGVDYYGVPVTSRTIGPFDVTTGGGTPANWNSADYANASFTGICQVCHTATLNYNQTLFTPLASHHGADITRCTTCHAHTADFTASGCDNCHGNVVAGSYWPDGTVYPDRAGDHQQHIDALATANGWSTVAQRNNSCLWCHPNPGGLDHDTNTVGSLANTGDVHGDPQNTGTSFLNIVGVANSLTTDTYDNSVAANGKDCSNVDCHYRTITPTTGTATANGDGWYQPAAVVGCGSCHAWTPYATNALPNAHNVHVDENAGGGLGMNGASFGCFGCHPQTALNYHQNASVEIAFNGTYTRGEPGTTLASATGSDNLVKYGGAGSYATCNNLFCHGADTYLDGAGYQLAGGTRTAPRWNQTQAAFPGLSDGRCGTCHDTGTQTGESSGGTVLSSGNHPAHLTELYGPNFDESTLATSCDQCHPAYTAVPYSIYHVNGTRDFDNIAAAPVVSPLGTLAVTTPTATDTDRCTNCHSTTNIAGIGVGTVLAKANWTSGVYRLECMTCHNAADPATSTAAGGAPLAPAKDASWTTRGHGNTTSYPWVPNRSGAAAACADCHAIATAHLSGALGQDRLTTAGNTLCNGCHGASGSATRVSTHANTSGTMGNPPVSYTAQRALFELNCVECHDVHGTTNIFMVNQANPDGPLVAPRSYNGGANTTSYLFQGAAVAFTANALGSDYAVLVANANKICQTCHTTTGNPTPVYQHNSGTTGHDVSTCTGCHGHDIDADYALGSQDGFMPKGDCKTCHNAASPFDPGNGDAVAPGIDLAAWTASGHGKASGPVVDCTDCHNTGLPSGPITHLDGTYNSVWENGSVSTRNTNTAHLKVEFFSPVSSLGAGAWDTQVTFDNRCYNQCHAGKGIRDMRHSSATDPPGASYFWSVQMGTKASYANGDRGSGIWKPADWAAGTDATNAPYPIDCDLNTGANCADVDYAPCVACHNPHGTAIVDPANPLKNYMMWRKWITFDADPFLCQGCHP